jgi:hypothetical protein
MGFVQTFGLVTLPKNRIWPVERWRRIKRKGRSALKILGWASSLPDAHVRTMAADPAAASVPSSSMVRKESWRTSDK